jgi:Cu-processing system permease protein
MGRIWAVAINTFREAVRDKVLYGVLGFACAVLLLSLALAELSLHQQRRVVLDIGIASISLFSVVIAIFLGSSLLYKEIEKKTLYVILPKPIRRWEFLLGKYLGIVLTAAVFIALMGGIQLWVTSVQADEGVIDAAYFLRALRFPLLGGVALGLIAWRLRESGVLLALAAVGLLGLGGGLAASQGVDVPPILAALVLVLGEVVVLSAVAMLFGSFSTPFLTGALSFGVWLVGRSADEMADMRSEAVSEAVKALLRGLARVVPNFHLFVPGRDLLTGELEGGAGPYLLTTSAYGLVYAALLLFAAALIFRRRDFL